MQQLANAIGPPTSITDASASHVVADDASDQAFIANTEPGSHNTSSNSYDVSSGVISAAPKQSGAGQHVEKAKIHECGICKVNFVRCHDLRRHSHKHCPREWWRYECDNCTHKFYRKDKLAGHMKRCGIGKN